MRTILLTALILFCMSASIRIDGVWPPEPVRDQLEMAIDKLARPGRTLTALVGELPALDRSRRSPLPIARPAEMFRIVVDSHYAKEQLRHRDCS